MNMYMYNCQCVIEYVSENVHMYMYMHKYMCVFAHVGVPVHVGVTFLLFTNFHDVQLKQPLTFHNGFIFFASRSCFHHFCSFQATSL